MRYFNIAAAVLMAGSFISAAPAWAQEGEHAGQTLRVATWGGDWRDKRQELIGQKVEEMTGAKVEYVLGNPRDNFAKLIAGAARGEVPFDVIEMEDSLPPEINEAGFLMPLSEEDIPTLAAIPDELEKNNSVAFLSIQYGIAYNTEKFEELGLPAPTKWSDLARPELAGRVAVPDLSVSMGPFYMVGLARENGGSESDVTPAWEKLENLDVLYYFTSSSDLATRMTAGDVWAAVWTDSRTYRLKNSGFPVDFAPVGVGGTEGMIGYNSIGIVEGTPNEDLAEMYVNLSLDPQIQYEMGKWGVTGPTNPQAEELFAADEQLSGQVVFRDEDFDAMYQMDWDTVVPQINGWMDTWNRTVTQ